ncbi:MAG: hydroxyacid dehydrogenase [Anaerolineales bacterium]|jgi:D-3-phosphoglycerate dehydrogenase|nr:hydroxyacid dehydrogenase [Anaerolineales bacterium]WKZ39785.1 MAG: hydroxyacid dehydrogenase [Anaerolineales bacterium]
MKVLICDKTEQEYIEQMRAAGLTVDVRDDITPEELMTTLPAYDGMVVRSRTKVRKDLIDVCPNLKVIVRGGAGLDTIDHEYAKSKGIAVMNTPLANSKSVAELAIGYMLMLARSLYKASETMKAEKWEKKAFTGDEIGGKTLGLIGIGNIGKETAKRAIAMDMTVVAYDPYVTEAPNGIKLVSLDELLAQADYISLHLPKTKESTGMIGAEQFAKMKNGVRIVNCARGGIVSEDALYEALTSGKVAGAALDVFNEEPPTDWKLAKLDNVIASPHIGAATREAQARVGAEVAEKLIAFSKNGK